MIVGFLKQKYNKQNNFLISGAAILLILVFLYFLAENFSRPIIDLGVEVEKIKNLELEDPVALKSNVNEIEHLKMISPDQDS